MNRQRSSLLVGLLALVGLVGWSVPRAHAVSNTVVISQFQIAGGTAADEFIELHNLSATPFELNGFRVVYRSAGTSTDTTSLATFTTSTIIPAGGYYLIAHAKYDDATAPANVTYGSTSAGDTGQLSGTAGGIALRNGAANMGTIIDSVGYGTGVTNGFVEGTSTTAPSANNSQIRKINSCLDTDNNSNDFQTQTPSAPRNTSSSVNSCTPTGEQPDDIAARFVYLPLVVR